MRKLHLRESKGQVQGHTAGKQQSGDPSPSVPDPPMVLSARTQGKGREGIWGFKSRRVSERVSF